MYDFGKLGKWSKSTLKAQMYMAPPIQYSTNYGYDIGEYAIAKVKFIEEQYKKLYTDINFAQPLKTMTFLDLKTVLSKEKNNAELSKDYEKYQVVMRELVNEKG